MRPLRLPPLSAFVDDVQPGSFRCEFCRFPLVLDDLLGGDLCPHCGNSVTSFSDGQFPTAAVGNGLNVAPLSNKGATSLNLRLFLSDCCNLQQSQARFRGYP